MVSSIVDRALDYLQIKKYHTWYRFDDFNSLEEYMMLEMVTILTYVKPSLSVHEAMWTLLLCDFNLLVSFKGQISNKALIAGLCLDKKQSPSSVNKNNPALPLKETQVTTPKPEAFKNADYYLAGIPYDESEGEHGPQDDQDKMILAAVGQLQSLQKEVKSWDDWASVKVMQVAKRLSQDRLEIKKLKAEKVEAENLKKDKEVAEKNTKKKLSELTAALTTTDCQFQMSSSAIARLESENLVLKRERERAENRSLIEAKSLEEALCKELEALNKSELCGFEKKLLEEDLKSLKQEVGPKQWDLEKAKHLLKEMETKLAQEEREAAKFHEQAESIRNERERLEAADERAGKELEKIETEIKRIQYEIAALNLEAETKKKAAITGMSWQLSEGTLRSQVCRNNYTRRECVMCLTEEMTVLFVPCGHQVLCAECNVVHEDNGMKECPSCRTPIQKRINCLFAES
ncbi:hypothetical protein L1987_42292 [Smallanthus sonchifolius]|uniref:Uncharacterized protein n=1 Tax=Smallanthus sonchifolius TaxID=185202 RepID=A0ACB9GX71_9ASTR|nr:hypothetical protein L1987_42292 [Smallanthus sonchifolius]